MKGSIMPDILTAIVTIRKTVNSPAEGKSFYQLIKEKLEDDPTAVVSGHFTTHYDHGVTP